MPTKDYPSVEYIRQLFTYDNGELYWKNRPPDHFKTNRAFLMWNKRYAGKKAGCKAKFYNYRTGEFIGYRIKIGINGKGYLRSRVVWAFHHGRWPDGNDVDHEYGDTLNDRIEDIQGCSHSENIQKKKLPSHNKSGYKGVSWFKPIKKWRAGIRVKGKYICLGYFNDPAEAGAAYMRAAREYYGKFASDGKRDP